MSPTPRNDEESEVAKGEKREKSWAPVKHIRRGLTGAVKLSSNSKSGSGEKVILNGKYKKDDGDNAKRCPEMDESSTRSPVWGSAETDENKQKTGSAAPRKKGLFAPLLDAFQKKSSKGPRLQKHFGGGSKAFMPLVHEEIANEATGGDHLPKPSEIQKKKTDCSNCEGVQLERSLSRRLGMAKKPAKSPRVELEREKEWIVEYYKNEKTPVKIESANFTQNCQIRECQNATVYIGEKLNNVIIESCKGTNVILAGVISSVELVHCEKVKLQVLHNCPSVNLDNCNGFTMYVGMEGKNVVVTSSRSCDMNINFPISEDDDEVVEVPIPQQFVHTINPKNRVDSKVSDLYR